MTQKAALLFFTALLAVGCRQAHPSEPSGTAPRALRCEACYHLGDAAELRLLGDGDLTQLELLYGGELQELVGTTNTMFVRNGDGGIALDTVHLDGGETPQYIVRTCDRSSTYGAEVWYVVYPLRPGDGGDGPWCLAKIPWDIPGLRDIDGDSRADLLRYPSPADREQNRYCVYSFDDGIFHEVTALHTAR